jgi:hydrogenase maturation protease
VTVSVLVIGVGNPFRRDDGVGLYIAQTLQRQSWPHVALITHAGEGAALVNIWTDFPEVLLIDAMRADLPAGTVQRFDVHEKPLPAPFFANSSHVFGVAEAVELARTLGQLPPRCIVYGIQGQSFATGPGLTPAVQSAADRLIAELARAFNQAAQ